MVIIILRSFRPSQLWCHKSRMSLQGPPYVHGVANTWFMVLSYKKHDCNFYTYESRLCSWVKYLSFTSTSSHFPCDRLPMRLIGIVLKLNVILKLFYKLTQFVSTTPFVINMIHFYILGDASFTNGMLMVALGVYFQI